MMGKFINYISDNLGEGMSDYIDYWKKEAPQTERYLLPILLVLGFIAGVAPGLFMLWLSWSIARDRMVEVKEKRLEQEKLAVDQDA